MDKTKNNINTLNQLISQVISLFSIPVEYTQLTARP